MQPVCQNLLTGVILLNPPPPPPPPNMSTEAVKEFINTPIKVPKWSSHSHFVERCVKTTPESACHVFGQVRRDTYIRGRLASRELIADISCKKELKTS